MSVSEPYDDRLLGELAALADGSLEGRRRAELEARVAEDPELASALDEQKRAVTMIRAAAAEVEAPPALRERIERERTRTARAPARRRWAFRISVGYAVAGVGAALAALFLAVTGGPTVEQAVAFAAQPPTAAAPPADGPLLPVRRDGVAFPAWTEKFGWEATGTRTGEVDGREATTVYYDKDGKTLAYTIVGGDALEEPGGRVVTVEGTPVLLFSAEGRRAATWQRQGRTCVLTGEGVPDAKLAELAGWKAKGAVPF